MRPNVDYSRNCDKCGLPVDPHEDAVQIDLRLGASAYLIMARPRHLLATEHCEGSPSRAQYLEGQPRDTRGYRYDPAAEAAIRAVYAEMQDELR